MEKFKRGGNVCAAITRHANGVSAIRKAGGKNGSSPGVDPHEELTVLRDECSAYRGGGNQSKDRRRRRANVTDDEWCVRNEERSVRINRIAVTRQRSAVGRTVRSTRMLKSTGSSIGSGGRRHSETEKRRANLRPLTDFHGRSSLPATNRPLLPVEIRK